MVVVFCFCCFCRRPRLCHVSNKLSLFLKSQIFKIDFTEVAGKLKAEAKGVAWPNVYVTRYLRG